MKIQEIYDYTLRLNKEKQNKISIENNKPFWDYLKDGNSVMENHKITSSQITIPENIKEEIQKDPNKKKLFNASVEFEAIFVKLMLKEMKKSIAKSHWIHGGYAEEIFEDLLTDEQAKEISKNNNLGLAEKIYSSLSKFVTDTPLSP